ncbi:Hypothetical protein IALB_2110 [Ignavibacterium album JCM 16511]|uniref:Uncharacterized protein n=1 Tax=Ignavibacterium album (strain DSM 19864 / JCM 16511 / NBRC 101810 / Mat9-16) TaxID=945713 RepID=I0ALF8_IGNAJ|nr:hypothetical protein [Ignavibacterium album]AFH49815.1 Hypothetical protein IALB_2110 [Ignavibacterium album JCM 16511]
MPGGEPSFHYSGTFAVEKQYADKIKFSLVKIYYKDEIIHQSKPYLQFFDEGVDDTAKMIKFNFYSEQGIKVTEKMMIAETVNFLFIFESDNEVIEKEMKEITLTRAY